MVDMTCFRKVDAEVVTGKPWRTMKVKLIGKVGKNFEARYFQCIRRSKCVLYDNVHTWLGPSAGDWEVANAMYPEASL